MEANNKALDSFSREHVTTYMHGLRKDKCHSKTLKKSSLKIPQISVI